MQVRRWSLSFEDLSRNLDDEKRRRMYQFPPEIEESVKARDKQRCRITGATNGIALSWIFPSPYRNQTKLDWYEPLDKDFVDAQNVLTMRSDLKYHFHSNRFSVDVDDGYRIVVFRDMGPSRLLLPTHLPRHPKHGALTDAFLRDHLRFSLVVTMLGGDILEDYSQAEILQLSGELIGFGRGDERDAVPLTDERWKTPLGQEILANEIRIRSNLRRSCSSDSLSSEDSDPPSPPPS
ncbi:hypothetical protein DFH06DRAFT_123414 [Mycena polygramma]|nr:hypothetical protein DFH06DRAFT_123414 [Mycena polygramma]